MLKSVKISNFGSINEEITFTMEKGKTEQFPENVIEGTDLLKTVLIYGKNNSGKSRFINSFKMLKDFICEGKKVYANPESIHNIWNLSNASSFEFIFLIDKKEYKYILLIDFLEEKVLLETLTVEKKAVFIRYMKQLFLRDDISKFYLEKFSNGSANVTNVALMKELMESINKSENEIKEINEEISYITFSFNKIGDNIEINNFYNYVQNIFFVDQQRKNEGENFYAGFDSLSIDYVEKNKNKVNKILKQFGFDFELVVIEEKNNLKLEKTINVLKENKTMGIKQDFNILMTESFGTITFLKLILMALTQSDRSFLMVIDEIERGVHPLLVANFIKYINQYFPNVQLILPTHMTDLLSIDLNLRKDQIYITDITDGVFSIKRSFNKTHIRETMNFQKILKSNAVGGNPEININSENEES